MKEITIAFSGDELLVERAKAIVSDLQAVEPGRIRMEGDRIFIKRSPSAFCDRKFVAYILKWVRAPFELHTGDIMVSNFPSLIETASQIEKGRRDA